MHVFRPFTILVKSIITLMVLMPCCFIACAQTDPVTNQTIITLHKAGIGKEIITAKINNSACSFDLSTDGLIALKHDGVPDDLIAAMITKGSGASVQSVSSGNSERTLEPGLYYYNPRTKEYSELDPAILTNSKQGGFGEAMKRSVSGLFNAKAKATLTGREANIRIPTANPLFVFVFDREKTGFNDNTRAESNVESPNEFTDAVQSYFAWQIVTSVNSTFGLKQMSLLGYVRPIRAF